MYAAISPEFTKTRVQGKIICLSVLKNEQSFRWKQVAI